MTKEELREHCEKQVKACEMWAENRGQKPSGKIYEEHKLILDLIKALEQQPSEDCVSREKVRYMITGGKYANEDYEQFIDRLVKELENMPPVTPTRKVSKWIDGHCANCGCDVPAYIIDWKWEKDMNAKWCPQCGAEMKGENNNDKSNI